MLLLIFTIFPILNSVFTCPVVKTCLHSGEFSNMTCACDCGKQV